MAAGAGWQLQGDSTFSSATNYIRAVLSTNAFTVVFKPIPGWNVPTNQSVTVIAGTDHGLQRALHGGQLHCK